MTYEAMLNYLGRTNRGILQADGLDDAEEIRATG